MADPTVPVTKGKQRKSKSKVVHLHCFFWSAAFLSQFFQAMQARLNALFGKIPMGTPGSAPPPRKKIVIPGRLQTQGESSPAVATNEESSGRKKKKKNQVWPLTTAFLPTCSSVIKKTCFPDGDKGEAQPALWTERPREATKSLWLSREQNSKRDDRKCC
jgi:hypothetical protein